MCETIAVQAKLIKQHHSEQCMYSVPIGYATDNENDNKKKKTATRYTHTVYDITEKMNSQVPQSLLHHSHRSQQQIPVFLHHPLLRHQSRLHHYSTENLKEC